jgi:hypothetical protein
MALIECPECKHAISDRALSCPSCGLPLSPSPPRPVLTEDIPQSLEVSPPSPADPKPVATLAEPLPATQVQEPTMYQRKVRVLSRQRKVILAVATLILLWFAWLSFSDAASRPGPQLTLSEVISYTAIGTILHFISPFGIIAIIALGWFYALYK